MTSIRRIYTYLLTFAGLAMLSIAVANLAQVLIDTVLISARGPGAVRDAVALNASAALVGLIVWLAHWSWLRRITRRDPAERTSTLRRLFLYAVLASSMLVLAGSVHQLLQAGFDALLRFQASPSGLRALFDPLPYALVATVVWLGHWRVASADRLLAGETGGSATLRRWYLFGIAFIGAVTLLVGLSGFVESIWRELTRAGASIDPSIATSAATALIGLGLWMLHWRVLPSRLSASATDEGGVSVLRSVYLFLTLAVAVVGSLFGTSQLLYYAVGRALGVEHPGGVSGDLLQAAAGPASIALVYGAAWIYQRYTVSVQAQLFGESRRQRGVRRLYTYLVALAGLITLMVGAAGLLWTLADLALANSSRSTWSEQVALFATLALVGLPVWLRHWRPSIESDEARALSRRLYLYISLIAAALALIGSAAGLLYRLIGLVLGASFDASVAVDVGHALAAAVVSGSVAVYHWRIVRRDSAHAASAPADKREATVRIEAADPASLTAALDALRASGVRFSVL